MDPMIIKNEIEINATPAALWDVLTNPEQTKKYMYGSEAISDWKIGSPLIWKGEYDGKQMIFVKGKIVDIKPEKFLAYTVIDPNSGMEDVPENYLTVTYELINENGKTKLIVTQGDFSTVADGERRYQESYNDGQGWNPIMIEIKRVAESTKAES